MDGAAKPRLFGVRGVIPAMTYPAQVIIRQPTNLTAPALAIIKTGEYQRNYVDPAKALVSTNTQSYQSWYDSAGNRRGYLGYGNTNNDNLIMSNETATGAWVVFTNAIQRVSINSSGNATFAAPASGITALFQGVSASGTVIKVTPAGATDIGALVDSSGTAGCRALFSGLTAQGSSQFYIGANNAANDLITGSAIGELCIRSSLGVNFTSNGGTRVMYMSSNLGVSIFGPTTAVNSLSIAGPTAASANAAAMLINTTSTASQSFGMDIRAGTNSADYCAIFRNQGTTANLLIIRGNGEFQVPGGVSTPSVTCLFPGLISRCSTTTNFTSNTTLAAITGMNVAVNEVGGIWSFEGVLFVNEVTSSAGGFKMDFQGGTVTVLGNDVSVYGITGTTLTVPAATGGTGTLFTFGTVSISTAVTAIWFKGFFAVNATGTFGPRGAQSVSSANTTSVLAGSWMRCYKIT